MTPQTARSVSLRPARPEDVGAIYLLYLRTTPSHVASLEGSSLKVWQSSFAEGAMTRMSHDDIHHFVVEEPGVVAWAAIRPASATRPTLISLMCDGHNPRLREAVIDGALRELPSGPRLVRAGPLQLGADPRSAEARFRHLRHPGAAGPDLASKVRLRTAPARKKPVLVHAHLAHSVPADSSPNLRVLNRRSERSPLP